MKILLLGEYSNVHATLADGLRLLGHKVTVMSNGDFWKDYPRDVDLSRREGKWGGIALMARLVLLLPQMVGYDVVQLINPMFVELKAERIFPLYRFLRRHNRRVVLGAMGMDYYWVHECCTRRPLRYSDFNMGDELRSNADALKERHDWIGTAKERLNKFIAEDCDAIVAGLYEYWPCYHPL
ncbi:MAG: glycosyltransferase family 1 protein, partial [Bacteroidaceae bacterium]